MRENKSSKLLLVKRRFFAKTQQKTGVCSFNSIFQLPSTFGRGAGGEGKNKTDRNLFP
jgi:hypothetical protein